MAAAAVSSFEMLPTRNFVRERAFTSFSRSHCPSASDHTIEPAFQTAALIPGTLSFARKSESIARERVTGDSEERKSGASADEQTGGCDKDPGTHPVVDLPLV